ncbi:hypothetical protein ACWCQZ_08635 [Streptomyces sp. NPDC002285]
MADSPAVAEPGRDGDAARAWAQPLRAAGVELSLLLSVPVGEGVMAAVGGDPGDDVALEARRR